jgi:hypothetical protein
MKLTSEINLVQAKLLQGFDSRRIYQRPDESV